MKRLILASGSPRRKEILAQTGLQFEIIPSDFEETANQNLSPSALVESLSLGKAKSVAEKNPDSIVIGADTMVFFQEQRLGKPKSATKATEMLQNLSGKEHSVITGFTVIDTETDKVVTRSIETKVFFRPLTEAEIKSYVDSGEPLDKAGAYGIQELGGVLVEKIEGDYYNVVGLPLCELVLTLKEFGVNIL